ncbi:spore germination protein [Bacillus cereus]|uniref:Spore germination protein B1 n=1 Tax=Bacillus mobilis TaxID=2026190 RepID=A0A1Y6A014_9BACI|nr:MULTISPECIES: spore germination protein [Bacillus cereus group]MBL3741312.1 spore germination protein [Bacillus cereus]MBL3864128.1 spore germination protein [Bacillus cereus]SME17018.1 Spore germination protein B1 [Bacillus mobilis]HDR6770137.1 spore germination protein [Bacillus cereus]
MKYLWEKRYLNIPKDETSDLPFTTEKMKYIQDVFCKSKDLIIRPFELNNYKYVAIFLEPLIDQEKLEKQLFLPLTLKGTIETSNTCTMKYWDSSTDEQTIIENLLNGFTALFIEEKQEVYFINTPASFDRSTEEPANEKVVSGSHQGFIENLHINLNLLRRSIENPNLYIDYLTLGKKTNSKVAITYMKGIANDSAIQEVMKRLNDACADMIFNPGYLEEFIEDSTYSPFPQILKTERVDRVKANLIEGRIAIMAEGNPTALIVPINFFAFYQSPDDYNTRPFIGSFIRIIRLISFWIAITFPALYIAVIGFHFEVLPNDLVLVVKGAVENIPYPPLIEALVMELTIELIREAGIRLPAPIGQTIGIVGGLVIGDAVVKAGLISNTMIVVVAITAIAAYVVPSDEMSSSIRLLRFPLMLAAASLGFLGIVFCLMFLFIHLCEIESFGTPYFAPIAPLHWKDLKDAIIRVPIWKMKKRPKALQPKETTQIDHPREWKEDERK